MAKLIVFPTAFRYQDHILQEIEVIIIRCILHINCSHGKTGGQAEGWKNRSSTRRNYYCVWKSFNNFIISLDRKPRFWEDKLTLFVGFLIHNGKKSSTVRSYVSAVKAVLLDIDIELNYNQFLIQSLTRACRLINDQVCTRLPIYKAMLHLILQ